eukprot:8781679-Pyramimonas_sp.AAC.1
MTGRWLAPNGGRGSSPLPAPGHPRMLARGSTRPRRSRFSATLRSSLISLHSYSGRGSMQFTEVSECRQVPFVSEMSTRWVFGCLVLPRAPCSYTRLGLNDGLLSLPSTTCSTC